MESIKNTYIKNSKLAEEKRNEFKAIEEKEEKIIEKYQRLIQKHEALREKAMKKSWHSYVNWIDGLVEPLAQELAKRAGKEYKIYGPFGMGCHTTIYLVNDKNICITKQDTWSITLEPHNLDEAEVFYQTTKKEGNWNPLSTASLNGFDYNYEPLPNSIEEVEKLLSYCHKILETV